MKNKDLDFITEFSSRSINKIKRIYFPNWEEIEKWVNKWKQGMKNKNVSVQKAIETESMYNLLLTMYRCVDVPSFVEVEKKYGLPRGILRKYHSKFIKDIEEVKNEVKDEIRKTLDMNDIIKALSPDSSQEYSKFVRTYILGDDNRDKPDTIIQIGEVNIGISGKKRKKAIEKADKVIEAEYEEVKELPKKAVLTSDFLQIQAEKMKEVLRIKESELNAE